MALRPRYLILVYVFTFVWTPGCKNRDEVKPVKPAISPVLADNKNPPAVTEVECREFSNRLETAIIKADGKSLTELIRYDEIVDRSMNGLDIRPEFRRSLIEKLRNLEAPPFAIPIVS